MYTHTGSKAVHSKSQFRSDHLLNSKRLRIEMTESTASKNPLKTEEMQFIHLYLGKAFFFPVLLGM
jgi:hypothetical protein